jgi:hypothetical protein
VPFADSASLSKPSGIGSESESDSDESLIESKDRKSECS